MSVLFLDICGFSAWPSGNHSEQAVVLKAMNVFMAEMMNIVRDFEGTFEKNTGDGLMAYFGTETAEAKEKVRLAVDAATIMHYVNDNLVSPWLVQNGCKAVAFRIGIDFGEVTIGRVGIPGGTNSFVAIGSTANIACKIMRLIPEGGICIGNEVYKLLPPFWSAWCAPITQPTGFVYIASQAPYPAWRLDYRVPAPNQ
ncbi:MAG: adenylate/guanylate cyclase domain-containing protein [Planctomycetota bacterium]|nr:adenylate/guanylate cyclase domain-containing protein [Planctomycetota bacterium]